MGNYVFAYTGGSMAETPEAQEAAYDAGVGPVVRHAGRRRRRGRRTVRAVDRGPCRRVHRLDDRRASGYSVIQADSLELAAKLAGGCPVLDNGGAVEVYESIPM